MSIETTAQHHPYSASGAAGWLSCPGKLVMEKGLPDTSSIYADEGSAAHFLASTCLESDKNPEEYKHFGIICWITPDGHSGQSFFGGDPMPEGAVETSTWKIDAEMVEHVSAYTDYVRSVANGGTLLVEQRVEFGSSIGISGAFGTADAIVLSNDGEDLYVIDLKYGRKEVSAFENPQMQLYDLGVLNGLPEDEANLEDLI
jgi:hypothetical protein